MSIIDKEISRKNFLRLSAGAIAGAAFLHLPQLSFAAGAKAKSTSVRSLPDAVELARSSELVQLSYQKIKDTVATIKDARLRSLTAAIINDPNPTFMQQFALPGRKASVYQQLVGAGLLDPAKTPLENFLPPYNGKTPQPFYSAPGSGYGSHHAYPGGLATHTAVNLEISAAIYNTYDQLFQSKLSRDIIISSQALHDLAKPLVFQWQEDQSSLKEYSIAGTGAHHIFSLAEVIYRDFPAAEIVAQACAHTSPTSAKEEQVVAGYLKAAAIIAGKDAISLKLVNADGTLPAPHQQEGYITHLGDHDFILSVPACQKAVRCIQKIAAADYGLTDGSSATVNRMRNYLGAQVSMMYLNSLEAQPDGYRQLEKLMLALITR